MRFPSGSWDALRVYLVLSGATAFGFALIFTVNLVYHVQVVGLNPLQLVLVGTLLEIVCLLLEVPTGVVADVYSRRLSILIGLALLGVGFVVEGSSATFAGVLLAQVFWGTGATFMSGATDAWITDEIGEDRAGAAFLQAAQVGQVCSLAGIGVSVLLAGRHLALPIVLGGLLFLGLALLLWRVMPEQGFRPAPRPPRQGWRALFHTTGDGLRLIRARPLLVTILLISVVYGLFSEGLDRLATVHFLQNITLPPLGTLEPVTWFGLISAGGGLLALFSNRLLQRRVATTDSRAVSRVLTWLYTGLIVGVLVFALAQSLLTAILALWLVGVVRAGIGPLESAWLNLNIDSRVRATVLSFHAQSNALGQIAGGPLVGALATFGSLRLALSLSALLLTPALGLFVRSRGQMAADDTAA
ncbi:MAG: MFS transporter [Anaerolineae bacterium]|jgi:DHA3 family tetracycline resistance protein-like MFS transporter|nr:MFS transporter [Anaerolineae bacterium]